MKKEKQLLKRLPNWFKLFWEYFWFHYSRNCCWLATLECFGFEGETIISEQHSNKMDSSVIQCNYIFVQFGIQFQSNHFFVVSTAFYLWSKKSFWLLQMNLDKLLWIVRHFFLVLAGYQVFVFFQRFPVNFVGMELRRCAHSHADSPNQ